MEKMPDLPFLGFIAYDPKVVEADLSGTAPYQGNPTFLQSRGGIGDRLLAYFVAGSQPGLAGFE